jgi:subtilisin family serine protease
MQTGAFLAYTPLIRELEVSNKAKGIRRHEVREVPSGLRGALSMLRYRLPALYLLLSLTVLSCKDSTSPPVPTTVVITAPKTHLESLGEVIPLAAQVKDQKGRLMGGIPITWSSSSPAVAEVGQTSGLVEAMGSGSADIQAQAQGATGSVTITVTQTAASFRKLQGDAQTAAVGEVLGVNPRVQVRDALSKPIADRDISFQVSSGGGSVSASSVKTDTEGKAEISWQLGTDASTDQALVASVDGFSLEFTATARPGPPFAVTAQGGDEQTGYALEALDDPLVAVVSDRYGNLLEGLEVIWSTPEGHGSVSPAKMVTDTAGSVEVSWVLGEVEGTQTAVAAVASLDPLTFTALALPNAIIEGTVTFTGEPQLPRLPAGDPEGEARVSAGTEPQLPANWRSEPVPLPGELIVTFRADALGVPEAGSELYRSQATTRTVGQQISFSLSRGIPSGLVERADVSPALLAARIRVSEPARLEEVRRALQRDSSVRSVEPNFIQRMIPPAEAAGPFPTSSPEPGYPLQAWNYEMIRLPEAWDVTTGSAMVTVAVVDDGTRFDHWDLADNLTSDGFDFVDPYQLPGCTSGLFDNAGDGDGPDPDPTTPASYSVQWSTFPCVIGEETFGAHGAHVAGTIGAVGNNGGVTGVNWSVSIRPVRALGTFGAGTTWGISQGILYAAGLPAEDGTGGTVQAPYPADIINMSFGGTSESLVQRDAVEAAAAAGCLMVAAGGNEGTSAPHYPSAYPEVMGVSAVNPYFDRALYSNWGSYIDIAAPGGSTPGRHDSTHWVFSTLWNFSQTLPAWGFASGTSMATPHVSGVAALILANEPGLSLGQLRSRLLDNANPIGPSDYFGAGLLDAYASLRNGIADPADLYVRLIDAETGAVVSTEAAGPGGSFRFSRLPDGQFYVYAGHDRNADGEIGTVGRSWGAWGGPTSPTPVVVTGTGIYPVEMTLGWPMETEGNDSEEDADLLLVGGYVNGELDTATDRDTYRVLIPESGTYTFETLGWGGACGLAAQANTHLTLLDDSGQPLASSGDQDRGGYRYCSAVTTLVQPGVYLLRVEGEESVDFRAADQRTGYYRVRVSKEG